MPLIKSISGIRGTIGGSQGENLTPIDIVKFTAAYAAFLKKGITKSRPRIVTGRDARTSGAMVAGLVNATLTAMGFDVIDAGLSTTPTIEIAVTETNADGGIILTASHNPAQWNALKLLDKNGEFISDAQGKEILEIAGLNELKFAAYNNLGKTEKNETFIDLHIKKILELPLVDVDAIKKAGFAVAVDAVNSTGGIAIPALLEALGVERIERLYCEPDGLFPHNPEPLPENISEITDLVVKKKCHVGFVVDPDVDRLAIVTEEGNTFGEEYTLVAVADYVLQNKPGNTVSNLSSTRALRDVTEKAGGKYSASAVGEVNVVAMMKETNAVIGGEGNGGVIYPELHYGRDALVGIALFLTYLAKSGKRCSLLRYGYPDYFISKNKITLEPEMNVDSILQKIKEKYSKFPINTVDGVRIELDTDWVHLRKSNTEPIIRIYSESDSEAKSNHLAQKMISDIIEITKEG
jgi:phosphomannomutase